MTVPHVALVGFTAGASIAFGLMAAMAVRSACAITRAHRWADVQRITGGWRG
jgi:energy-converting hydrogenase Eha subunit G